MFLNPLGLLALLAVPAVIGLHLFRRRFRPRVVSAVFLWAAEDRAPVAGRKREPLRSSPSFWCELLAALLLALALAGLRVFGAGEAQHLVVVLDSSASMAATHEDGAVDEAARELVRARVGALPRGSRVTLVASGSRPALVAGPAAFTREALEALGNWRPAEARHDLAPAVALGQQLAGDGALLVVTDHLRPGAIPPEVEAVSLGRPADNLAFTHATRRRERDEASGELVERVHLTVSSFARAPRTVDVTLAAGGQRLSARRVTLAPGAREHVAFTVPAGTPPLEARLPADALAIDDVAWLAPEPPRTLALASLLPEDLSVYVGLMSRGQSVSRIDRWLDLVPDAIDVKKASAAHLVLTPGGIPAGDAWVVAFQAPEGEARALIGPFLLDRRHALLQGVTLEGIVWSASAESTLLGAPIVSAGNEPLLTEARVGERVVFQADLDLERSSLHRSPDWPILLANLAELRRAELPGPARTNLAIGETFVFRDRAPARYRWTGAGETGELEALGTLAVEDVTRPGVYTLARLSENGADDLCSVAFSFADPAESDLSGAAPGEQPGQPSVATMLAGFTWMEIALLAAVLAVVALDWWVLSGRRSAREIPA